MASRRSKRPSDSGSTVIVAAPTLKEAYKIVRRDHGKNAVILDTRGVTRRQEWGLGHSKWVEVVVQTDSGTPGSAPRPRISPSAKVPTELQDTQAVADQILMEVERVEALADAIQERQNQLQEANINPMADDPAASALDRAGVSGPVTEKIVTRFRSESDHGSHDAAGMVKWLKSNLKASNCDWDGFYGCHAFLGRSGSGRTEMVLASAARLQALGRKVLVLAVMPPGGSEVRRLQSCAAEGGFDAAVVQKADQLTRSEPHLARYDVVLVDMPALDHPELESGGVIHSWLAANSGFHRHLVAGLDSDLSDIPDLAEATRSWNCDWVAVSRRDLSRRPGKVLDLVESVPLPISLVTTSVRGTRNVEIASSGPLVEDLFKDIDPGSPHQARSHG